MYKNAYFSDRNKDYNVTKQNSVFGTLEINIIGIKKVADAKSRQSDILNKPVKEIKYKK